MTTIKPPENPLPQKTYKSYPGEHAASIIAQTQRKLPDGVLFATRFAPLTDKQNTKRQPSKLANFVQTFRKNEPTDQASSKRVAGFFE